MCGIGKCPTCGDMSYECGPSLGTSSSCGCFNDFSSETKEEFNKLFMGVEIPNQKRQFIDKHGFREGVN